LCITSRANDAISIGVTGRTNMPKLTPEEVKRDVIMRFVVTQDERKEIKAAANKSGMGVSPWLRSLALKEARK
jgi:hypothetical protein